jgi:hypothetical protein
MKLYLSDSWIEELGSDSGDDELHDVLLHIDGAAPVVLKSDAVLWYVPCISVVLLGCIERSAGIWCVLTMTGVLSAANVLPAVSALKYVL